MCPTAFLSIVKPTLGNAAVSKSFTSAEPTTAAGSPSIVFCLFVFRRFRICLHMPCLNEEGLSRFWRYGWNEFMVERYPWQRTRISQGIQVVRKIPSATFHSGSSVCIGTNKIVPRALKRRLDVDFVPFRCNITQILCSTRCQVATY